MKFGPIPVARAEGTIAAHSLRHAEGLIRKGRFLLKADIEALKRAGVETIVVARLEKGDVHEDRAAAALAEALGGPGVRLDAAFTGRVNLFAATDGVFVTNTEALARMNRIDEAITLATLMPFTRVTSGRMVATVKIIPYAVREKALERALAVATKAAPLVRVAAFSPRRAGLVATRIEGTADKMLDKTTRVLSARLEAMGSSLGKEIRCNHDADEIARAVRALIDSGHDPVLVFGASAIIDRRDMVPAGIRKAGGRIESFGMPVDPGNLLLLARIGDVPVIGAPGCARSIKENGFDWVLERLVAGLPVGRREITALGSGGLLMEIETRPQPRVQRKAAKPAPAKPGVAAVVLAAGRSRRMGGSNKLLADFAGKPLVRHAVEAALASRASPVIVVTGHMEPEIRAVLDGLDVRFVQNTDYAEGLSTSMRAGIAALPGECDGALFCLGDMPGITTALIDRLIDAFAPEKGRLIVVPTFEGKRGNPVLFSTRFRDAMSRIEGDVGARHLIGANAESVVEVAADMAALIDVDTPQTLAEARRLLAGETADGGKGGER